MTGTQERDSGHSRRDFTGTRKEVTSLWTYTEVVDLLALLSPNHFSESKHCNCKIVFVDLLPSGIRAYCLGFRYCCPSLSCLRIVAAELSPFCISARTCCPRSYMHSNAPYYMIHVRDAFQASFRAENTAFAIIRCSTVVFWTFSCSCSQHSVRGGKSKLTLSGCSLPMARIYRTFS